MRKFVKKNARVFISILLIIIALQFSVRAKTPFTPYRQIMWAVSTATFFVADIFTKSVGGFGRFMEDYFFLVNVAKENKQLKEELEKLKEQAGRVEELESENERLRVMLRQKREFRDEGTAARVISYDLTPWSSGFFIDLGKRDGVETGMAAILPEGVAGRVYRVFPTSSMVISIKDHRFALDVRIQRTRLRCILKGTGAGCQLKYVRTTDDLKEGDVLVTTGFGGYFPSGVRAGIVSKTKEEKGSIFRKVEVVPYVDLRKLETVYIVKGNGSLSDGGAKK
jgi:rod shape-determining protein MreC